MTDETSQRRVRATYDAIADAYEQAIGGELDAKPLDRGHLDAVCELAAGGRLVDLGCGPGHVTAYLAQRHPDVLGVDLSPEMVRLARERHPDLAFEVGSMLGLDATDASWAGVVALYSVIHLTAAERAMAMREVARVLRPGGWLLLAFHVESPDVPVGGVRHLTTWFDHDVDVDGFYLAPETVRADVEAAGLTVAATTVREPWAGAEHPSRRCLLLARRP